MQCLKVTRSSSYSSPNFRLVPVANKRHKLQHDDINGLYGPSTPSPLTFTHPPPPSEPIVWPPSIHPSGQLFSLWEHDFITEMNCLIVKTQLPPFTGEGGASLDIGASCSDPASGVSSPTVWKASHVTHHWMTAPSSQPRALSQPHRALMCWTSLSIFTVLNECIFMDTKYMKNMAFNTKVTSLFILEKNLKYLKCLTILEISF